ncbi:MAG: succinyl-diaminopimelate desuccinylase [Rhodospirillaceae bacterium]|nr:succinyl-diaminopimelate desuccinylase [Rhodospirillaceae bacterium]
MPGLDQPLELARALIRCPSVTPKDAGALDVLQAALEELGFTCHRIMGNNPASAPIDNLYARLGTNVPNFCFAGHTDVVPAGDRESWSDGPFSAEVRDGKLFGRGASDMKGAIAAFVAATARFLNRHPDNAKGSISLLITGDEEGPAVNGTRALLDWLGENNEQIDLCLVGEPTNPERLGDMIKIGRRGSLNARLTVFGTQGHAAYPALADNPLPRLIAMLGRLTKARLDDGNAHFQPSNIQITTIDVGNEASNVTPAKAEAAFNIRFNDGHSSDSLGAWLHEQFDAVGGEYKLDIHVTGEAFLTPPGELSALISDAVEAATGRVPELSTTGGTSDARFIKDHCAVAEFGLIGATMHKVDEHIELAELDALTDIYENILERYFSDV